MCVCGGGGGWEVDVCEILLKAALLHLRFPFSETISFLLCFLLFSLSLFLLFCLCISSYVSLSLSLSLSLSHTHTHTHTHTHYKVYKF